MFHLYGETQAAEVHGPADAGPRGGFLRHGDGARRVGVRQRVELLQERDGIEVLAASVLVRDPLPVRARVIEVQHRGDGVDAETIEVVLLEPEQRVRQQEVADLVAAVVEDQRAPVLVLALPRVFVLVERGAVEAREAVRILREVARHPVEQHADAGAVTRVDEVLEVVRVAVTAGRREEAGDLVAPRSAVGMFQHRQQLDVREALFLSRTARAARPARDTSASDARPRARGATRPGALRRSTSAA
jgi:hypothetical protein